MSTHSSVSAGERWAGRTGEEGRLSEPAARGRVLDLGPSVVLALALVAGGVSSVFAGDAESVGAGVGTTLTADLEYQEVDYEVINWGLVFASGPVVFQKEPDFGTRRVTRRALKLGADAKAGLPLAWDRTEGKLYLDLNRNADLTDDAHGVFTNSSHFYYQTFLNVRLPLTAEAGGATVLVDLNLSERGEGVGGYLAVKSYWQGRLQVGQRDWQVGVVPERAEGLHPGYLLLRPWERRAEPFAVDGSADALGWPQRLFWRQQGYTVAAQVLAGESPTRWRVELAPVEAALGDLQLTGQHLSRVLLAGGEWTVILDEPAGSVRVPEGTYARGFVWLAKEGATACRDNSGLPEGNLGLPVGAGQVAVFTAGGPLTNRVSVTRRGRLLVFNYQLVGAEGATYRLGGEDRSRPPTFAVYQAEKEIATGKFEFG